MKAPLIKGEIGADFSTFEIRPDHHKTMVSALKSERQLSTNREKIQMVVLEYPKMHL